MEGAEDQAERPLGLGEASGQPGRLVVQFRVATQRPPGMAVGQGQARFAQGLGATFGTTERSAHSQRAVQGFLQCRGEAGLVQQNDFLALRANQQA